jgi:Arc/MetJ family transcription regulator
MKTTIDIADLLLRRAKALAARRNTTLKAIVEDALREALRSQERRSPLQVEPHTFSGRGLQPGLSWDDWGTLRDLAYEGRGG